MTIISIILFVLALFYFTFLVRIRIGLRKSVQHSSADPTLSVSVIVAARNEELLIDRCLKSLSSQVYPPELMEILVVDDCSTDTTKTILKKLQSQLPNL